MKLIVGLGNPGEKYAKTRHNVGFMILDYFAKENQLTFTTSKFKAEIAKMNIKNETVLFVKPQTFMNLSGDAITQLVHYYQIDLSDILIIYDDLDLEVGKYRIRKSGSSGGQNGMKDIIAKLKTEKINRIRIGISKNKLIDTANYVLGKFNEEQSDLIIKVIHESEKIIKDFITHDVEYIMNRYNKK